MQKKLIAVGTALAMFATATPALAAINSSSITILVTNRGSINNDTSARSHTGDNEAHGSTGGAGGNGGVVDGGNGSENNGGASAGNGGNGGNGGAGGLVQTGNATSDAGSENGLNGTDLEVELGCDCPDDINSLTIDVTVDNDREAPTQNHILNDTRARARTGDNEAHGSTGGIGGTGGGVVVASSTPPSSENNGGASAGTGGAGGAGGLGGTIGTGNASSTSGAVNLLNTTLLRVRI